MKSALFSNRDGSERDFDRGDKNRLRDDIASSGVGGQGDHLRSRHYVLTGVTSRGLLALRIYRFRRWVMRGYGEKKGIAAYLFKLLSRVGNWLAVVLAKSAIDSHTPIGPGVYISKQGNVIIGAAHIGRSCVIQHDVTIGMDIISSEKPTIGDHVWIGAGSMVYGRITVGGGTTIREGSVLTKSVPPNCIVMGNPARVTRRDFDNEVLREHPEHPFVVVVGE